MILKEVSQGDGHEAHNPRGCTQEHMVADQLAQAFADDPRVLVFNDISLAHRARRTRIDHLVVHPFGAIIIESRRLHGEVWVDRCGNWSRCARGRWVGIPSPLHHAQVQQDILRDLLAAHWQGSTGRNEDLPCQAVGGEWKTLCALPDRAMVHRERMPGEISACVVTAEAIGKQVRQLIGPLGWIGRWQRPRACRLGRSALERLGRFLLDQDARLQDRGEALTLQLTDLISGVRCSIPAAITPAFWRGMVTGDIHPPGCRVCGTSSKLIHRYGRFGHSLGCTYCGATTSLNLACQACGGGPVTVRHSGATFTVRCSRCCYERVLCVSEA